MIDSMVVDEDHKDKEAIQETLMNCVVEKSKQNKVLLCSKDFMPHLTLQKLSAFSELLAVVSPQEQEQIRTCRYFAHVVCSFCLNYG